MVHALHELAWFMPPTAHAHCSEAAQRCRGQGNELSQVRDQLKKESAIPPESYRKHGQDADVF